MIAHDAQRALVQSLGVLMLIPVLGIVVAVGTSIAGWVKRRRPTPVPVAPFIPAQRTGAER